MALRSSSAVVRDRNSTPSEFRTQAAEHGRAPRGHQLGRFALELPEADATPAAPDPQALLDRAAAEPPGELPQRAALETQFGRPLGDIAIYANPAAAAALELLGARAATRGRQIFLADAHPDLALLAHEVVHVLQTRSDMATTHGEVVAAAAPAEHEAEKLALRVLRGDPAPLPVEAAIEPNAIALRRTSPPAEPATAPPEPAAADAFARAATAPAPAAPERAETRAEPPAAREGAPAPDNALAEADGEAAPAFELPPAPAPGVTEADVAAQEQAAAEAQAALEAAETPNDLVAAFAAAPPSLKAQQAQSIGGDLGAVAQTEEQSLQAELPEFHAELNSQVEPVAPISVAAPEAQEVQLEATAPPPAPEPDIPPTPAAQPYTANDGIAGSVSRLFSGDATDRADRVGERLHDVQTTDPEIVSSPGPAPQVPLEGASDPARIDDQAGAGTEQARQSRDTAQRAVLDGPGPEQVQPLALDEAHPVGELAQPAIEPGEAPAATQAYLDMGLPPEVQVAFDQQQQAAMQQSMTGAQSQVEQATSDRDAQREQAVSDAETQAQELSERADQDQRDRVQESRQQIQDARQDTLDQQTQAVSGLEADVAVRRAEDRSGIDGRVQRDEEQIDSRYAQAETDARSEVRDGERRAADERARAEREAEDQSWWDRAVDFVRDAFQALTSLIGDIFDAVRQAVNAVLDAAKAFAQQLIDAAAAFINDLIAAFGEFLKGLVDTLLGDLFPELAAALNAAIDSAVQLAQAAVNLVAEGLKSGIAALVEGLRAGLNAIIDAYQGALQLALGALQAALTGDWAALARMALEAVLRVAGIDPEAIYAFIGRAQETFQLILDDPGAFVGHLLDAFMNGVRRFSDNFLTHLQAGIIGWLTGALGSAGITLPERFDLMGVLSLVQQILGLTWERLRQKAVRLIGEQNVVRLEFMFSYIQTLVEGGWSALFERIQQDLGALRDTVLEGIKSFLLERVVIAAITRLATLFNPVGAIVQLVLAAYNLFTFLRDQLQRIAEVVQTVVNAIGDIARGIIEPASQRVEEVLARLLPLALDLLARLLGLGNVGGRVREIIERVQAAVDRAIDALIERVLSAFRGGGRDAAAAPAEAGAAAGGATTRRAQDDPFTLGRERHTLRAEVTPSGVRILMASNGFAELEGRIQNIRSIYITGVGDRPGLMHGTPSLARQLGGRLDAIQNEVIQVIHDANATTDEAQKVIVINAGLDRIDVLLGALGDPPFRIETEATHTPPTHRISPLNLDSNGRATAVVGDPISSASRGQGSAPSVDPAGIFILQGVPGVPAYERGHLVAGSTPDSLGGPGNDLRNLTPISQPTNTRMRVGPERVARDTIYDSAAVPPNILRYTARSRYPASNAGLETWLVGTVGAASGAANRLFALARSNAALDAATVHTALGGAGQLPLVTVQAQLWDIRKKLAKYFLADEITVTIESLQGSAAVGSTQTVATDTRNLP